ncbi:MAG: hypothetical protein ACFE95_04355 [Candidatus Hodarchaeota archaeon]
MKKKLSVLFLMVSFLVLIPALSVSANTPLYGTMDLQFNLGWPGPPQTVIPDWVGTITIDGEEYGMAFFAIGTGKPFGEQNEGSPHFFVEVWRIYDGIKIKFNDDGVLTKFKPGSILLWGYDTGLTNLANSKYHMTGTVEEAFGPFSMYVGRNVYMSGEIIWYPFGAPQFAPGIFRID